MPLSKVDDSACLARPGLTRDGNKLQQNEVVLRVGSTRVFFFFILKNISITQTFCFWIFFFGKLWCKFLFIFWYKVKIWTLVSNFHFKLLTDSNKWSPPHSQLLIATYTAVCMMHDHFYTVGQHVDWLKVIAHNSPSVYFFNFPLSQYHFPRWLHLLKGY